MVVLSEKAKGKQRAIEPINDDSAELLTKRPLIIRFTDGLSDLTLTLQTEDTVRRIKQQIREHRPQVGHRRLRLIHAGQILVDNVNFFDWLKNLEKQQRRSKKAANKKSDDEVSNTESGRGAPDVSASDHNSASSPIWLHCLIGEEITEGEKDEERVQERQIKPARGFDRLAAAGFSAEDIASFRRTFHSQSAGNYIDTEFVGDDEDYDEHAHVLEEQWIDSLDSSSGGSEVLHTSAVTILQGLMVGFFFPLLPFFFLIESRPAIFWENGQASEAASSVIFSKKMQMALVLGFISNITFGLWRFLLGT